MRPALGACPVVGDDHDQRVVQLADRLEEVQQAPDLVIGVLEEAGEDLHHAGVEPAFVVGELVPLLHVGVVSRQHRVLGDDAQFLLPREHLLAVGVPAVVELALVLVGPFLGHLVGRMVGAGREVEEERFVGRDLFEVGDELDRLVGQIDGEVVTLLGRLRRLDLMVVEDQVGIVLVGVTAEEAVVAVEPAPQRPAVVRAGRADLFRGCQVPFADAERGIAVRQQHLGQEPVLERDRTVGARVARRPLGDARHAVGVVVSPVQHAGPRRRAQRRGVHVRVAKPVLRQPVQVGGVDRRAVATELPVAGVVQHDVEDVRRAGIGANRGGPCRLRLADGSAHAAGEGGARLVLVQTHLVPLAAEGRGAITHSCLRCRKARDGTTER